MKQVKTIIFLIYLVFGVYFINAGFNFISIPEAFSEFDQWIVVIGGVLILIGAINYLRAGKKLVSNLS